MPETQTPILPATRVLRFTRIRRERVMPARGLVTVAVGNRVGALDVVAKSNAVGHLRPVPLARYLRTTEAALPGYVIKKPGEEVQAREIIASKPELFGTLQRIYRAPGAGRVAALQGAWLAVELIDQPFELKALYRGSVVTVMPRLGVVIEAAGALAQGVWGTGGEGHGVLKKMVDGPTAILTEDKIDVTARGVILLAGAGATEEAVRRAAQERAAGLIVGSLPPHLRDLVKTLSLPTLVTEGWGEHAMSAPIFELLASHDGDEASINMAAGTQTMVRPEVFIPAPATSSTGETALPPPPLTAEIGAPVRIVGRAHFVEIGKIVEVPTMPRTLESGITTWGAEIELATGGRLFVPWENLELLD